MTHLLVYSLMALITVIGYMVLIHPLIKSRPEFRALYELEGSIGKALAFKLDTIKTKLVASLIILASIIVETHDVVVPMLSTVDMTPITSKVPSWLWPIINIAMAVIFYWLRKVTEYSEAQKLVAVEEKVATVDDILEGVPKTVVAVKNLNISTTTL